MARDTRPAKSLNSSQRLARIEEMEYDAKVLRQQYETELTKLRNQVVNLEAELKTLRVGPCIEHRGCRYAPVALTEAQAQSVWDAVNDIVSRSFGDGDWVVGNYKDGGLYRHEIYDESDLLPGIWGYVAQGGASDEGGWHMDTVWGLVQVPHPCRDCKAPTMGKYNCCPPCQVKRDAEAELSTAHWDGQHETPHPECVWCKD